MSVNKRRRPTGRRNNTPASDRRNDTPFAMGQSRGQIRFKNQGTSAPKDLQARDAARREYNANMRYYPLSTSFDDSVRIPSDPEHITERRLVQNRGERFDGFVIGQRIGRFCPRCSMALPVIGGDCQECG